MKRALFIPLVIVLLAGTVFAQEPPKEGVVITRYKNGNIKDRAVYKDGKLNGLAQKYYEDGTTYQEVYFENGLPEGVGKIYNSSGELEVEYLYKYGKKIGERRYDEFGKITKDTISGLENGVSIKEKIDSQGRKIEVIELIGSPMQKEEGPSSVIEMRNEFSPETMDKLVIIGKEENKKVSIFPEFPFKAVSGIFLVGAIIAVLMLYILMCIPLAMIAKKTGTGHEWMAYVPIANAILMCWIAGRPTWWILLFLIPFIGPLIGIILFVIIWMGIAEARQKPSWLGLLILVPAVGIIVPWYIALAEPQEAKEMPIIDASSKDKDPLQSTEPTEPQQSPNPPEPPKPPDDDNPLIPLDLR
ncbi:MAG: DUF5684 domain-containing protein [Candidatus Omnitrophota bacterium]